MDPMNDDRFRKMMQEDPSLAGPDPQEQQVVHLVLESLELEPGIDLPADFTNRVISSIEKKEAIRNLIIQCVLVAVILIAASGFLWALHYFTGVQLVEALFRQVVSHLWLILPGMIGLLAVQFADFWLIRSEKTLLNGN
jgi:hypothetical protein